MQTSPIIKELNNIEEWKSAFPVMKQLRTHLSESEYLKLVQESVQNEGYKMAALYDNGKIVAVTGFMPSITLYNGHFVFVCDLITDSNERSKGFGEQLLSYVQDWAKANGYSLISLTSGLQRVDAHRFYETKMKYDRVSYSFIKPL